MTPAFDALQNKSDDFSVFLIVQFRPWCEQMQTVILPKGKVLGGRVFA